MKFYKNDIVYIKANQDLRGVYPNPKHDERNNPLAIFSVINPNVPYSAERQKNNLIAIRLIYILKSGPPEINILNNYIGAVIEIEDRFLEGGDPSYWNAVGKSELGDFYHAELPPVEEQKITIPTDILTKYLGYPDEETRGVEESGLKYLDAPITQAAPGGSSYEEVRPAMATYVPDSPPSAPSAYTKPSEIVDVTADSPPYVPTSRHESGADLSQLDKSDDLSPSDTDLSPSDKSDTDLSPSDKSDTDLSPSDTDLSPSDKSDTYLSPSEKYKSKQELVALITKKMLMQHQCKFL